MMHVRLDGRTLRGAKDISGNQVHLLAALAGPAEPGAATVVVAQAEVTGARPTNRPRPTTFWANSTNECQWRLLLGVEALAVECGGMSLVARL
jgi:hypothetical protein